MAFPTLCPLRYPLKNSEEPDYLYIKDTFSCTSSKQNSAVLTSSFGMREYDENGQNIKYDAIGSLTANIWDDFEIASVVPQEIKVESSASISTIAFAKHKLTQQKVVIKAFTEYDDYTDIYPDNLIFEIKAYQKIKHLTSVVPLFGRYVNHYVYPNEWSGVKCLNCIGIDDNALQDEDYKKLLAQMHDVATNAVLSLGINPGDIRRSNHTHYFLVTEYLPGVSLKKFVIQPPDENVIESILFQLLFALHVMFNMGFQHNDLHDGNIIVDTNPACKSAIFYINGQMYDVPTPVKIIIYDFDFASCSQCGPNESLGLWCKSFGICNERNSKFDLYTIFRFLSEKLDVRIDNILTSSLGPILTERIKNRFYSPFFKEGGPHTVKLPVEIIEKHFKNYVIPRKK